MEKMSDIINDRESFNALPDIFNRIIRKIFIKKD